MVVFIGLWAKKYHCSVRNVVMVCVAAIALGSSTYAWFVSNNTVKATTTTISAQSNAAFMYIRDENEKSTNLTADTSSVNSTALYPAHWVTVAENSAESGNYTGKDAGKILRLHHLVIVFN